MYIDRRGNTSRQKCCAKGSGKEVEIQKVEEVPSNTTVIVFDGTSPTFYFTNTSGWNTSSSNEIQKFM